MQLTHDTVCMYCILNVQIAKIGRIKSDWRAAGGEPRASCGRKLIGDSIRHKVFVGVEFFGEWVVPKTYGRKLVCYHSSLIKKKSTFNYIWQQLFSNSLHIVLDAHQVANDARSCRFCQANVYGETQDARHHKCSRWDAHRNRSTAKRCKRLSIC